MLKNEDKDLMWEEVSCEHIVQDEWIDFRKTEYRFPDGRTFSPFYSYSRRDYVVIVATDVEGNFICVRQFRHGIREVTTEFVAGGIERTDGREYGGTQDGASEAALLAAKRELLEESGYESDEWEHIITIPSNATVSDNYAFLFRAKNCHKVAEQSLDEMECLNVVKLSREEIQQRMKQGKFQQAIHVLALMLADKMG
ncbi:ADP-ribose pyrophosphatase [Lachnospiraceae bacterium XBB1006]|nr:ADP-ribose pyrophosphatase [Lachnospiraceae bacterium XBB1006]